MSTSSILRLSHVRCLMLATLIGAAGCDVEERNFESEGVKDAGEQDGHVDPIPGTPGVVVTPTSGLRTSESGGTATFTIALSAKPQADVTIALTSSNDKEGTIDKKGVVFTSANWDAPQTITVTGVDDKLSDGLQSYTIATAPAVSDDSAYTGIDGADVSVTNTDDDSAGVTVTPTTGLKTTEMGDFASFIVKLDTEPAADVTIALSSSNDKEGGASPEALVFTTENWNAPQTVTVTGVDDAAVDGPQTYKIITAPAESADNAYEGQDGDDVTVINGDDETPGITVSPTSGLVTTEGGGTATFTVRLNSTPTANVTIGLTSSDDKEGTVSPASLAFTADNWNAPQTVTITGVDDPSADGNQPYTVVTAAAVSDDKLYSGLDPSDVNVTNTDNDSAGITVSPTTGIVTTESGGTATFTIRLNSQPSGDVTIPLSSSKTTEGTVSPASVTFTATDWNAPQTVTITGADDAIEDGDIAYTIVTGVATSTDANYNGLNASDVSATNADNDSAIDCTTTACGATCAEVNTKGGGLPDGNYLILPAGTKPFTVYCHNMTVAPAEYLNVNSKLNYSRFSSVGTCDTCGDYTVNYSKVRFDPGTFTINTRDRTFAVGSGGLAACYEKYVCTGYDLNFASAGSCSTSKGVGNVDLSTNPFAFSDKNVFSGAGYKPSGSSLYGSGLRSVQILGGGGLCASYGINDGVVHPVGGTIILVYAP